VTQAVILGLGSMFNHSRLHQNVGWKRDVEKKLVTYRTLRDVKKGEELCISYGDRLTFVDVEAKMNESDDDETSILANITLD
jgi:SET domain-containing protein